MIFRGVLWLVEELLDEWVMVIGGLYVAKDLK